MEYNVNGIFLNLKNVNFIRFDINEENISRAKMYFRNGTVCELTDSNARNLKNHLEHVKGKESVIIHEN